MKRLVEPVRTRRDVLIGLGAAAIGVAGGPALARDRPTISAGRDTACDNAGVLVSDPSGRIATAADFASAGSCTLSRGTVEGPYFICADTTNARDIAEGLDGTPTTLAIRVVDRGCAPVPGAIVDVWQCDARGNYSGHAVDPDDPPRISRDGPRKPDAPTRFLRGVLAADEEGIVEFDAIYPGYYHSRAIHTHYKVHVGDTAYLTGQAMYPEAWNEKIVANPLYGEGRGAERVVNADDFIARTAGLFTVAERGGRLLATINLSVPV